MTTFKCIIDCILALGAIGTVGTFIISILQLKNQNKRIESLEQMQVDAKYRPDIRIEGWKNNTNSSPLNILIKNHGENVYIMDFDSKSDYLDIENKHVPCNFDSNDSRYIYLNPSLSVFPENFQMEIILNDKLSRKYSIRIFMNNKTLKIGKPQLIK